MMGGLTFSSGTVGVDEGAEWHEQLNPFLMKHNLSVFLIAGLDVGAMVCMLTQGD